MAKFIEIDYLKHDSGHQTCETMSVNVDWVDKIIENADGTAVISFVSLQSNGERELLETINSYDDVIEMLK